MKEILKMTPLEYEDVLNIAELSYPWEKLQDKTILISGGTGFIGSLFCSVIEYRNNKYKDNIKVISLSRSKKESTDLITYKSVDIVNEFTIDEPIDYVVHLASNTHPKQYAEDPIGTITTNIYGCHNLLKIANIKKARFLPASSVEIYGQGSNIPMKEDYCGYIDCNKARAGYNESKRLSEALLQSYRLKYGVNAVVARLSRIFGPDKKNDTKAIAQFIDKAVAEEDIVLKSLGNQRFSYCYVADAVSGLFKILLDGIDGEAYNISDDDDGLALCDYARHIAKLGNQNVIFDIESNSNASNISYALMNCDKLKSLGWSPKYNVIDGLTRTYKIKKCLKG